MKKAIKWIVIVVVLLIVLGVSLVLMNLDRIIKTVVESQGSAQLQVATKLGGAKLSILGGDLALNDFSVGSPKGFKAEQMLALGKAHVAVSYGDLRGDPVRVGIIELESPKLVIEQSDLKLNFKALMDQLPKGEPAPAPTEPAGESKPLKLIIDQINISGAEVVIMPGIPGMDAALTIPIPKMSIKNIGNSDGAANGAALRDVVMQVITGMASEAANSDKLPAPVKALLKGNVSDVANQLGGAFKEQIGAKLGDLGDGVGKAAGDILQGKSPTTQDISGAAGDLLKGFGGQKKDKK